MSHRANSRAALILFSIIGYFYVKTRGKGRFTRLFIPRLKEKNADFLAQAEEEKKG